MTTHKRPLFELGRIVATPGAIEAMDENKVSAAELLGRHHAGDWGNLCQEDREENEVSLKEGARLFSAYHLPDGQKLWVITEADRLSTTILRPDEY